MADESADIEGAMEEGEEGSDDPNLNLELHAFRAQWMSELKPSSERIGRSGRLLRGSSLRKVQDNALEEEATELFLRAVQEEQDGAVYEAIKFYRMAMQLVPDIEFRINYSRPDTDGVEKNFCQETDVDGDIEELVACFEQQLTQENAFPKICSPEVGGTQGHISDLPLEILMYIFRWVVSSDLDMRALEQLSLVCRGFYICAREPELWRSACLKVWGRNCSKLAPYRSWREMFLLRPHVRFDGIYVSKASYLRQGEQSLDGFYRPLHHVAFYRYLRFFSDGSAVMLTSPEEPISVVPRMRSRNPRMESVLFGHYRLSQERDNQTKVFAVLCKKKEEKPVEKQLNRFCRRNPAPEPERSFYVGLYLSSRGRQRFSKLEWFQHSFQATYQTGEVIDTTFNLDKMYTPFYFARVKSYTAFSEQHL